MGNISLVGGKLFPTIQNKISISKAEFLLFGFKVVMNILILDDEEDLCTILTLICLRKNFTVSCASNLADALKLMKSLPVLLFLDNNLTNGVGLEMIEQIKARYPLTKIAFITASSDQNIQERAFSLGADYFLAKPFHLQGVRDILSRFTNYKSIPDSSRSFVSTPSVC